LGEFDVVGHDVDALRRQVLLDLPDIDSKYADHVELTRRMLRKMLFPIWVQSVEKYADARPQQLLRQVAEGNDPRNFRFVLSKCDQLIDREGLEAAGELAQDYGERLQRALALQSPPEVLLISAHRPDDYDLPRLRDDVRQAKSEKLVAQSKQLAKQRQLHSIAAWGKQQDLAGRAASTKRLLDDTADRLAERVGRPILEEALPATTDDLGRRMELIEPAVRRRLRAWPIVNLIDAAATPVVLLVQKNLTPRGGASAAIEQHLSGAGQHLAKNLQATFAELHQAHPTVADYDGMQRLWESPSAEAATASLRKRLAGVLSRQRTALRDAAKPPAWLLPIRWLLTIGAVAWFLVAQPVLAAGFELGDFDWYAMARRFVDTVSAQALLTNVTFVAIYLVVLWALLRLATYRRAAKWRAKLTRNAGDAELSQEAQVVQWMQSLLAPLASRHAKLAKLQTQVDDLATQTQSR
ncbi:MAG: hypothetical protein AAGK78_06925, partial [Planctomycetota bacterium]